MDVSSRGCVSVITTIFLFVLCKNKKYMFFPLEFCVLALFLVLCPLIHSLAMIGMAFGSSVRHKYSHLFISLITLLSAPTPVLVKTAIVPF